VNRKTHRRLASAVWCAAAIAGAMGIFLLVRAFLSARQPRDFGDLALGADPAPGAASRLVDESRDVGALAGRKMTRTIVKPPPAPPPKPTSPSLESLIALAGVLELGGTREAVIEIKQARQARNFREGDAVGDTGVTVKSIREAVVVEYDGKTFRLTVGGGMKEVGSPQ